ncbi:unnamed protein product, partial [Vitis vinifera]|uniref:Uncharacterized protein n=1 Tax=Vitis vinifera TaxID=29760 RepID=D7T1F7_VITVI
MTKKLSFVKCARMLVGGILDDSPSTGVLLNHFPTQSTLNLKVEERTTISPQPHKMVFHKVSPTIRILLSVLLLFLTQQTLPRELTQVASYEDKTVYLNDEVIGSYSDWA